MFSEEALRVSTSWYTTRPGDSLHGPLLEAEEPQDSAVGDIGYRKLQTLEKSEAERWLWEGNYKGKRDNCYESQ